MNDYAALLTRLRHLVKDEMDKQRLELERQWPLPLALRVARGFAIEGLRVDGVRQGGTILLSCRPNASRFREGDLPVLLRGDPHGQEAVECLPEYDDEKRLEVGAAYARTKPHIWYPAMAIHKAIKFLVKILWIVESCYQNHIAAGRGAET